MDATSLELACHGYSRFRLRMRWQFLQRGHGHVFKLSRVEDDFVRPSLRRKTANGTIASLLGLATRNGQP